MSCIRYFLLRQRGSYVPRIMLPHSSKYLLVKVSHVEISSEARNSGSLSLCRLNCALSVIVNDIAMFMPNTRTHSSRKADMRV